MFTEQGLAQVVARTWGALRSEADVYRLAAPMGRVWRSKIQVHFKLDSSTLFQHTLADRVAHIPRTTSTDSDVQGCSAAAATGHEHDPASTVSVVHSSVVPTRGR